MVQQPAGTVSGDTAIRRYGPADFPALIDTHRRRLRRRDARDVRFAVSAGNTTTFIAERDGRAAGVAMAVSFGATAWIANVVVAADSPPGPGHRPDRGSLQSRREGAGTVLLLALGDAQRIYARLGFEPDGLYGTWRASASTARLAAAAAAGESLPVAAAHEPGLVAQAAALDRRSDRRGPPAATSSCFAPSLRVVCGAPGEPVSWAQQPHGVGHRAVVADDLSAARVLFANCSASAADSFEFPDANEAGVRLATELGLERFKGTCACAWVARRRFSAVVLLQVAVARGRLVG